MLVGFLELIMLQLPEAKVVSYLKNKGIEKSHLSRDEFLKYAWEWTNNYGGKILNQLKKLAVHVIGKEINLLWMMT